MHVQLSKSREFDLTLSGNESQEHFQDDKYKALACGSIPGRQLSLLVDTRWEQWASMVEDAPWLRNWVRSKHYRSSESAITPFGAPVDAFRFKQHAIATAVFVETVWGFGMADWLHGEGGVLVRDAHGGRNYNAAMRMMLRLQNVRYPSQARTYMWDDKIYRGCGLLVPCEIGDLDRWLEPMWQEVLASNCEVTSSK